MARFISNVVGVQLPTSMVVLLSRPHEIPARDGWQRDFCSRVLRRKRTNRAWTLLRDHPPNRAFSGDEPAVHVGRREAPRLPDRVEARIGELFHQPGSAALRS